MNALFFAWTASISYGLYVISAKLIGKYQIHNTYLFSFLLTLFSGIMMAIISYTYGGRIPQSWLFISLAAIALSIGNVAGLAAVRVLDVSVISPLFNIRVVMTVVLSYLFLGERYQLDAVLLMVAIIISGFFATMDEKFSLKSFFSRNILIGLLFMLLLSIQSIFINRAIEQTSYWTAMLWMSIISIIVSTILLYPKCKADIADINPKQYMSVAVLAIIAGIGDLAAYKAFEKNVGLSSVIISLPLSMVIAVIVAKWKPNLLENHPVKVYLVRFIATGIMIWGALQLK